MIEPTTVGEALSYDEWIVAMQEELNEFQRNDVWDLVARPSQKNIIGIKWVFKNKLNDKEKLLETKQDLLHKDIVNKRE